MMEEVEGSSVKRPPPSDKVSEGPPRSASKCSSGESSPSDKQRFYFDSDVLVLKNNPDYQKLLKTLAVLEAQKIQAIKDLECLVQTQAKAERDPIGFVKSLKDNSLPSLPMRQVVAEIPNIEWKGYMECLQQVAKQHSSLYINTRRHSRPLISSLEEKPAVAEVKLKDASRSATYRQPWTPEEQARFEELLQIHPPERVERKRYQKIAKALGTRTTQQVCTHAQKYFIKLAQSGLPVPGRVPNLTKYSRKRRKGRSRKGGFRRPSTFFTTLTPRVFMTESESVGSIPDDSCSSDEDLSDGSELMGGDGVCGGEEAVGVTVMCSCCEKELTSGVYWHCPDCPEEHSTHLCSSCVNSDYRSTHHLPSHDLQMLSVASGNQMDKDYSGFTTQSGFNYLDPNYHPAS